MDKIRTKTLLKQFEELIKDRTVVFDYDHEDGFFIKVTDKSFSDFSVDVAELVPTKHHDIESAIKFAVDYLAKDDADFKEVIDRIHRGY